jgi:hypothetical protein
MVLIQRANRFDIIECEGNFTDVSELGVIFEVHPWGVGLCDIQSLYRHMLQIQNLGIYGIPT